MDRWVAGRLGWVDRWNLSGWIWVGWLDKWTLCGWTGGFGWVNWIDGGHCRCMDYLVILVACKLRFV